MMGRRGTVRRVKKKQQQKHNLCSEPDAQQPSLPAQKCRKKKHTRSIEARIRRAQSEVQKGIARQAQGPTDPYFAAISAATPTADAVALDSESSRSIQPDWDPDSPNNNDQDPSTEAEHYKNQKQQSVQPGRLDSAEVVRTWRVLHNIACAPAPCNRRRPLPGGGGLVLRAAGRSLAALVVR